MNRREAVIGLGALALSACTDSITAPVITPPVIAGVYEFSGFENPRSEYGKVPGTQCPNQYPWKAMRTPDRVPARGEYNEAAPWVQEYRAGLMEWAGISFTVIQLEAKFPSGSLLNSHNADNHPEDSSVEFAVSFWNVMASAKDQGNYYDLAA